MAKLSERWWDEVDRFLWAEDNPGLRQRNLEELLIKICKLTGENAFVQVNRPDASGEYVPVNDSKKGYVGEAVSEDLAEGETDEPIN